MLNQILKYYPPVVTVLGHVDHGKTTLLDAIRKTNIAQKEHGGITQKIGASSIEILYEGIKRRITFIDTPGHETFSKMRSRGAIVADIAILVVSAVDGVMPQTKESIKLILEAKILFVVALTKVDLPEKNLEKIKQQLLKEGVKLEGFGGKIPIIEVSAKTNKNIKELLELLLLTLDIEDDEKKPVRQAQGQFKAIVIESKLDPKVGPKASLVIKNGTVSVRDLLFCEGIEGRTRNLINDQGKFMQKASIGDAVEILGFEKVPPVGGIVLKKSDVRGPAASFPPASARSSLTSSNELRAVGSPSTGVTPPHLVPELAVLSIVLCADTQGSLEAIVNALPKNINLVLQKTGEISPADILLAKSVGALAIGFNLKIKKGIVNFATTEKVPLKNYSLIYELIDEIKDVLEGKELALEEKIYGQAKILASFPFGKTKVMGVVVLEGRIAKGDRFRLVRGKEVVGESHIASLRQGKNPISKVEKGEEAGVVSSALLDFDLGDVLVCHG